MNKRKNILKIAIDSPAAAGAGTLAKTISKHYNLFYLDTGKIYRLVAYLKIKFPKKFNQNFIKKKIKSLKVKDLENKDLLSDEVKKFIKYNNGRSIIYYEPYFKLCSNETELCKVYLKNNKQLFFRDPTHLTIQGSKYLSDHFDNYLIKTLKLN